MKSFLALLAILGNTGVLFSNAHLSTSILPRDIPLPTLSLPIPTSGIPIVPSELPIPAGEVPPLPTAGPGEFVELQQKCQDQPGENTYIAVKYQDGSTVTYKYGQCVPVKISSNNTLGEAQAAAFCKDADCVNYDNVDCTGNETPRDVTILAGQFFENADNLGGEFLHGVICTEP